MSRRRQDLELRGDMFTTRVGAPAPAVEDEFSGALDLSDLIDQVERGEGGEQRPPALVDNPSLLWGVHSGLHSSLLSTAMPTGTADAWQTLAEELAEESRQVEDPVMSSALLAEAGRILVDRLGRREDGQLLLRNSGSGEEGISAIPISARQLEALVRLGEASARSRLSEEVTKDDAKRAIGLVMHCLEQLGVDPDTGKMDIDRLTTGVTASTRNQVHTIKMIIKELADLTGNQLVPEEEILAKAEEKGIDELKAEEILEKLNRLGDIFRPKPGYYSMMQ